MDGADLYSGNSTMSVGDKVELIADQKTDKESFPLHSAKKLLKPSKFIPADHSYSFKVIVVSGIVFAIAITVALILSIYLGPPQVGANGAVATDVPYCSDIGLAILQKGGNAVDATVGACLCLGVINSHSSGLGGGGFMVVHDHKTQKSWGYDFREVAPRAATAKMFEGKEHLIFNSGLSVGVPGELKGLEAAHNAHGKLKWRDVVEPVADLARTGFNITKDQAKVLKNRLQPSDLKGKFKEVFAPGGEILQAGDFIRRPDLADTLDLIAEQGSDALYLGQIADTIIQAVEDAGGILSIEDLQQYKVIQRDIIRTEFNGGFIGTMPSPSSGPVLLLIMNLLEGFNWTAASVKDPKTYHQMIESFKFGYAHHGDLGDPKFNPTTMEDNILQMISKEYGNTLRGKIDNQTHPAEYYGAKYEPVKNGGTTHLSVVDAEELVVSLTTTINTWFGTKIMTSSGIILNNEMTDFTIPTAPSMFNLPPNPHNLIEPGKRPVSSMTPTIVFNKKEPCSKRMVLGASNGTKIISGVAEVIANAMLFNLNLTYAIDKPRLHNQLYPDITECEAGLPQNVIEYLQERGQTMQEVTEGINTVQAVMKTNDQLFAHSDIRKGGKAAIYTPKSR
ncbi:hypothetical protein SNE40_022098 [Patella caerulea]|uniref:Uncharacterized protein n=2 Tax=Patella caerulea TaxID=87958 RepID=A0AAN8IZM7_PATCE